MGWIAALKQRGYNAAYCPVGLDASPAQIEEYRQAAKEHDIVIAEVGAWLNNPLHPDPAVAEQGYRGLVRAMELAERIHAGCCVNVCGSRGTVWDGPHPLNLTQETFDRIVAYVQRLLDEVRPRNTAFSLEMMPWMFPTTAQENLDLIEAVGREAFVAHLDLVNITCSPCLYYENAKMTAGAFATLGRHIHSVHAKDIVLREQLTTHLDEVRPGLGGFDYRALLQAVEATNPNIPVMLEHLGSQQEYDDAAAYVRSVAKELSIACGSEV
jgi:sugar phosphate isomerase/epimerase